MVPFPSLRGVIDRRILVNFRLDPEAVADVIPEGFRPRTVNGVAIGGICCIRLTHMRPRGFPAAVGLTSENAAHRIGVEWDEDGKTRSGVYVPRRDTTSRLNSFVGSRALGRQYRADFAVEEGNGHYELDMTSHHGDVSMRVIANETDDLPEDSTFEDVASASAYHQCGCIGYSPSPDGSRLEGVELDTDEWWVSPLTVEGVSASFFETRFPAEAVAFDNALLMRDIGHQWRRQSPKAPSAASTS